jgi:hypothetical protein
MCETEGIGDLPTGIHSNATSVTKPAVVIASRLAMRNHPAALRREFSVQRGTARASGLVTLGIRAAVFVAPLRVERL